MFLRMRIKSVIKNNYYDIQIAKLKKEIEIADAIVIGAGAGLSTSINEGARNTEIKNNKQYIKAVIFNVPTTIDSYNTAKIRYDMPWLGQK